MAGYSPPGSSYECLRTSWEVRYRMDDIQRSVRALKHINVERHAQGSHVWGHVPNEGGHFLADGVGVGADEGEHDHGDAGGPTSGYPPGRANPSASAAS